jgi:hypothetical protein
VNSASICGSFFRSVAGLDWTLAGGFPSPTYNVKPKTYNLEP